MELEAYADFVAGSLEDAFRDRDAFSVMTFANAANALLEHVSDEMRERLEELLTPREW